MNLPPVNRIPLVAGLLFVALGVLFLLDQLEVIRLRGAYFLPVILIVAGLAILVGSRRSSHR